jgi:uracil-DNA glycosylase family 4
VSGRSAPRRRFASLALLGAALVRCERCPRLVAWREQVARDKRRAYQSETYWGRPVPGFGDPDASLIIVGLAPGAHGANRTGRMFTGDRSGDFLFAALHRAGVASQAESRARDDGLTLSGVYITAAARCAPPDNRPSPDELLACASWLEDELALLRRARVYLALGRTGYDAVLRTARARTAARVAAPPFGHGVDVEIPDPRSGRGKARLIASYHVSQQNTQTGRLTPSMFDAIVATALHAASACPPT